MTGKLVLHYFPRSHWSRAVSLLIAELGLEVERSLVDIRKNASFEPAYLALNPRGVVPTLCDGETVVWDSLAIARHLDGLAGTAKCPLDGPVAARVNELEAFPLMLFSYAEWVKGKRGERSASILDDKVDRARRYADAHPEHRAAYTRKAAFFARFRDEVYDDAHVAEQTRRCRDTLDGLGEAVRGGAFAAGDGYTFADAILTSILFRLVDLGRIDHWHGDTEHGLHGYFERMKARPSYRAVFEDDPLLSA